MTGHIHNILIISILTFCSATLCAQQQENGLYGEVEMCVDLICFAEGAGYDMHTVELIDMQPGFLSITFYGDKNTELSKESYMIGEISGEHRYIGTDVSYWDYADQWQEKYYSLPGVASDKKKSYIFVCMENNGENPESLLKIDYITDEDVTDLCRYELIPFSKNKSEYENGLLRRQITTAETGTVTVIIEYKYSGKGKLIHTDIYIDGRYSERWNYRRGLPVKMTTYNEDTPTPTVIKTRYKGKPGNYTSITVPGKNFPLKCKTRIKVEDGLIRYNIMTGDTWATAYRFFYDEHRNRTSVHDLTDGTANYSSYVFDSKNNWVICYHSRKKEEDVRLSEISYRRIIYVETNQDLNEEQIK